MDTGIGTSNLRSLGRRATPQQVVDLLAAASDAGVRYIDTADTYGAGSAERALGAAVSKGRMDPARFRVITKGGYVFPDLPGPARALNQPLKRASRVLGGRQRFDDGFLRRAGAASRRRLGPLGVYAYCLHNPSADVLRDGQAMRTVRSMRDQGDFARAGVSIDDHDLAHVVAALPEGVDLLELPAKAFLRLDAAVLEALSRHGTEVVVNRVGQLDGGLSGGLHQLRGWKRQPDVAIVGTRNPAHLRQNAATTDEGPRA